MIIGSVRHCVAVFALFLALSITSASQQPNTPPARIISLIPATTEMLFAIGAAPQIVAVGSFDTYPPEAQSLPRVGALLDPDVERILSLKPDLVVIYGTQHDLRQQLERAGVHYYSYKHGGLADVTATIRALGTRIGRAQEAESVAAGIESRLASIRRRTGDRPKPKTVLVFGRDRMSLQGIFASGGVGFLNDMLDTAGGENIFADIKRESVQATSELILSRAPEVILELRSSIEPGEAAAERAVWNTLAAVPAVRTGRVHMLADLALMVPGPRVARATELIAAALHSGDRRDGRGRGDGLNAEIAEHAKNWFGKTLASSAGSALNSSLRPPPTPRP
jgi:iron complex transport system substrate-binding protein